MTKLYLDLEETVIKSWQDQVLVKSDKLEQLLAFDLTIDRDDVRIFSFAIYDQKDQDEFERRIKPMLERRFGITITQWPSIEDIATADQRLTGIRWLDGDTMGGLDIHEFITIRGKVTAFENYVRFHHDDGDRHVLLDDVVPFRSVTDLRTGTVVLTINVDRDVDALTDR